MKFKTVQRKKAVSFINIVLILSAVLLVSGCLEPLNDFYQKWISQFPIHFPTFTHPTPTPTLNTTLNATPTIIPTLTPS